MLPAGWAVQKFGPKVLLGLDNYLQGAALLLVPTAAKLGVGPLCLCMAAMGVSQAPIFPGQSVMKRDFQGRLPAAIRPWAIQFMRLSAAAGEIFSKYTTPIISMRWGWQAVCYSYGAVSVAFAVFWGLLARSKPPEREPKKVAASAPTQGKKGAQDEESKMEYGVLKVPAAIAVMFAHASCNNLGYTMTQWAPVSRATALHCTARCCSIVCRCYRDPTPHAPQSLTRLAACLLCLLAWTVVLCRGPGMQCGDDRQASCGDGCRPFHWKLPRGDTGDHAAEARLQAAQHSEECVLGEQHAAGRLLPGIWAQQNAAHGNDHELRRLLMRLLPRHRLLAELL
jgi:MFS family permease